MAWWIAIWERGRDEKSDAFCQIVYHLVIVSFKYTCILTV